MADLLSTHYFSFIYNNLKRFSPVRMAATKQPTKPVLQRTSERLISDAETDTNIYSRHILHTQTWFGTLDLRGRFILDTPLIWFTIGWRFCMGKTTVNLWSPCHVSICMFKIITLSLDLIQHISLMNSRVLLNYLKASYVVSKCKIISDNVVHLFYLNPPPDGSLQPIIIQKWGP